MKMYAAKELVELANEWLQDDDEAEIDEITKEMFINSITLSSLSVYSEGDFEIFFSDGDIFWGHSIIVSGNIHEGSLRLRLQDKVKLPFAACLLVYSK